MADAIGIALGLAPLAEDAVRSLLARNTVSNLIDLVEADLRRSHRVPPGEQDRVAAEWTSQRVDPELVGRLTAWLATGQEAFLAGAGDRWRQLLTGRLDPEHFEIDALVDV